MPAPHVLRRTDVPGLRGLDRAGPKGALPSFLSTANTWATSGRSAVSGPPDALDHAICTGAIWQPPPPVEVEAFDPTTDVVALTIEGARHPPEIRARAQDRFVTILFVDDIPVARLHVQSRERPQVITVSATLRPPPCG